MLLKEFGQLHLADEAQTLAVFLVGGGQSNLLGDAPDFGLFQFAHGEQGVGQLLGVDLTQEVALILIAIEPGQQLVVALGIGVPTAIVSRGDGIRSQLLGSIAEQVKLDFAVAEDIGVGGAAGGVLRKHVLDDALPIRVRQIDDLEGDAQVLGDQQGVIGVVHPWAGVVDGHGVVDPVPHEQADDFVALGQKQVSRHAAVYPS